MVVMSELVQLTEKLGQWWGHNRQALGLSQAEVARRTNLAPATISAIEHARFERINKEHLVNILTAFFKEAAIDQNGNPRLSDAPINNTKFQTYKGVKWFLDAAKLNDIDVFVYTQGEAYPEKKSAAWIMEDVMDRLSKDPRIADDWIEAIEQVFELDATNLRNRRTEYEGEQTIRKTLRYIHDHPNIQYSRKAEIFDTLSDIFQQVSDLVLPDEDNLIEKERSMLEREEEKSLMMEQLKEELKQQLLLEFRETKLAYGAGAENKSSDSEEHDPPQG